MAAAITKYSNPGAFKDRYAAAATQVFSKHSKLRQLFPFEKKSKLGKDYHQAVMLTRPSGMTYRSATATEYTALKTPKAVTIGDAYLRGSGIIGQAWLTYEMMDNLGSNDEAFFTYADMAVQSLMAEIDYRREIDIIDGSVGLAKTQSAVEDSTGKCTVTFSQRTWSPARWLGTEGNVYQFYDGATQKGNDNEFTCTAVDFTNRTVSFSCATSADVTTLVGEINATGAELSIYDEDSYGKTMVGINAAATATSTLWGIDTSAYTSWAGQTYTLATATTLTKTDLFLAHAQGSNKGLEDAIVIVPPIGMAHLLDDLSDLHRFSNENSAYKPGSKKIEVASPSGMLEIMSHPLCTQGEAYMVPKSGCKRVGATEFTFGRGKSGDESFFEHASNDVVVLRGHADEAFFCETPGQLVKIQSASSTKTL